MKKFKILTIVLLIVMLTAVFVGCNKITIDSAKKNLESHGYVDFTSLMGGYLSSLPIEGYEKSAVFAKGDMMSETDEDPEIVIIIEFKDKDTAKKQYDEIMDFADELEEYKFELSGKVIIMASTQDGIDCAKKKK